MKEVEVIKPKKNKFENTITFSVKSISEILQKQNLKIPEYQRPYKWERRHIRNLFYDIREAIERNIKVDCQHFL